MDALARDAYAVLTALDGRTLVPEVLQTAKLVATVVGQDLEQRDDGMFRIARRVAKDRVISTVDPEARHGHKTAARGFDGYKGHIAVDPDSEIVTATTVTAGNVGDAARSQSESSSPSRAAASVQHVVIVLHAVPHRQWACRPGGVAAPRCAPSHHRRNLLQPARAVAW